MQRGRLILVDTCPSGVVTARRLEMQGYSVFLTKNPSEGAHDALCSPPQAVIADLWMPGISGVQLCRLLRAEPSTCDLPILLRGPENDRRSRFWAERAGANAYVGKGRMGDLVRTLHSTIAARPRGDGFFMDLQSAGIDIRDRIAAHLDQALFESVIAAEIRSLSRCGSFDRLFDVMSQFVSELTSYRWLAMEATERAHLGIHTHPQARDRSLHEAHTTLKISLRPAVLVEDEDAVDEPEAPARPILAPIYFGEDVVGRIAIGPSSCTHLENAAELIKVLAREVASPLQLALLMEDSRRLARVDPLTNLLNRRALGESIAHIRARAQFSETPIALALVDVDHFKAVNDTYGHAVGDQVLSEVARLLQESLRPGDTVGRWGGEEFLIVYGNADLQTAHQLTDHIRERVQDHRVPLAEGGQLQITFSSGVAELLPDLPLETTVDRADRAMYLGKTQGRNRVLAMTADDRPMTLEEHLQASSPRLRAVSAAAS